MIITLMKEMGARRESVLAAAQAMSGSGILPKVAASRIRDFLGGRASFSVATELHIPDEKQERRALLEARLARAGGGAHGMEDLTLEVDGQPVTMKAGSTILEACRAAGKSVPTLCHHPTVEPAGLCRVCLVDIGSGKLEPSCVTKVEPGMKVRTNTKEVRENVKFVLESMRARHPAACMNCDAEEDCTLQGLFYRYRVTAESLPHGVSMKPTIPKPLKEDHPVCAVTYDPDKCISCNLCVRVCDERQGIHAIGPAGRGHDARISTFGELSLDATKCIECGQCTLICPTGAMRETGAVLDVIDDLDDEKKTVIISTAPAVRVSLSEEFGLPPGAFTPGQMVSALKAVGFSHVFDTVFTADLTIMEESHEFLQRLSDGGPFPMFTSCCPGWVSFVEKSKPELIPNLSSCKSPQQMMGAIVKSLWAPIMGIDASKLTSVSWMPCVAKKHESARGEGINSVEGGGRDVDHVLTTREIGRLLHLRNIHPAAMGESEFDSPLGAGTGAGIIFGATGGVMEAALRTAYEVVTGKALPKLEFSVLRGLSGIKVADVSIPPPSGGEPITLRVAVANSMSETQKLLDRIANGDEDCKGIQFCEVMACRGGCLGGGGQPKSRDENILLKRMEKIYTLDERSVLRKSHENPDVKAIYAAHLGEPLGHLSHKLLHTHYTDRSAHTQ